MDTALTCLLNLQESWAICRIFKKTNSTAQRALSHSWVSSLSETRASSMLTKDQESTQFCSDNNMSLTRKTSLLASQFCTDTQNLDVASYKTIINPSLHKAFDHYSPISSNIGSDLSTSMIFSSPLETSNTIINAKSTMDVSSMLLNMSSSVLGDISKSTTSEDTTTNFNNNGGLQEHCCSDYYPIPFLREMQATYGNNQYDNNNNNNNSNALVKIPNVNVPRVDEQELETVRSFGFPFSSSSMHFNIGDAWKSNLLWDTSSCPCDVPSSYYSTITKCYT